EVLANNDSFNEFDLNSCVCEKISIKYNDDIENFAQQMNIDSVKLRKISFLLSSQSKPKICADVKFLLIFWKLDKNAFKLAKVSGSVSLISDTSGT
ncbi:hypothetical protein, partial [Mycoplasmopsis bovis]|uniref:hypothetical protein n=1 Tax=Mycoplasmopsis bovis TaxID=28903 RepID=UPI003D29D3BD